MLLNTKNKIVKILTLWGPSAQNNDKKLASPFGEGNGRVTNRSLPSIGTACVKNYVRWLHMTKTQSDCILNGCFIKPMNENIAVLLPVHSPRWVLGIGIRSV